MNEMNLWFTEKQSSESAFSFKIKKHLYTFTTSYQKIDVLESYGFGKILVLDGYTMFTDKDEFMYHEMITHVPLFVHPHPERVLIIGGGDGGVLREVLKHPCVRKATLVEVDEKVIEVSRKFFPQVSMGFEDERATVVIANGADYVEDKKDKFDTIIVDSTDPYTGAASPLFQRKFYQSCYRALKEDGIMVAQTESPYYDTYWVKSIYEEMKYAFPQRKMYLGYMPSYPGTLWSYAFASKNYDPLSDLHEERIDSQKYNLKYYNANVHRAAFALPNFIKALI